MAELIPIQRGRDGDEESRARIRASLDESLIVEAAAGTGKTTELIHRIVAVLGAGRGSVENLVAVTFTRKAAGELKLRLRQELDRALAQARSSSGPTAQGSAARVAATDKAAHLEHSIAHLEEARIGTIHSFCGELLRERPVEAAVDPAFEELSEPEARRLFRQAFRNWLEKELEESSPVLRRVLERTAATGQSPSEELYQAGWQLVELRDFDRAWERRTFAREEAIDRLLERAAKLARLSSACPNQQDVLFADLHPVRELAEQLARAEAADARRDYDRWEGLLFRLRRDLGRKKRQGRGAFAPGVLREEVVREREKLWAELDAFEREAGANLAALLQSEMRGLLEGYDRLKRAAGKLDFVDLLALTRNLIRDNGAVRRYLQRQFTHIFVDEFQDTDPLQAEILLLLSADDPGQTDWLEVKPVPGKLFLVGDPKQSVYRFRRADVLLYQDLRGRLAARGVGLVHLTHSFRASEPMQELINGAFEPEMKEDRACGQPGYVPLRQGTEPIPGQPYLVALPAPELFGSKGFMTEEAIEASLPDAVAAFIAWLIRESGWKVRDPADPGKRVPIEPRHVAVLFRRFVSWGEDITRGYRRALEAREILHLVVGATAVHTREEVETLRVALAALEWPDDELSVFATLKGSVFALPDSALLRYRDLAGTLHPFRRRPGTLEKELEPVAEALDALARLHRRRNRRPIVETLQELLESTRAHAGFALRPAGHQALANVYRLCDEARNFEASGGISFRAFVEELEAQAERGDRSESLVFEESAEGVRLMTVHAAKGLEFPVVILADLTARLARAASRYTDGRVGLCAQRLAGCAPWDLLDHQAEETARDEAEGVRVAYVAATRARDLLVVTAVGQEPRDTWWLRPLYRAIYSEPRRRRQSERAPGCPAFGRATALAAYQDDQLLEATVKPGLHRISGSGHAVVWWDPKALRLDVQGGFGLRQEEILRPSELSPDGERQYESWKAERVWTIEAGRPPEFDVIVATQAPPLPPGFECSVELATVAKRPGRPQGRRFGTLVHTALRDAALGETLEGIRPLVRLHGRLLGATPEEVDAATEAVAAALSHPLLAQARRSLICRREFPLTVRTESGRLVEGVLDLAFLEKQAWTVVDFKTDADLPARRSRYERQLRWYVYALSSATGRPARGCLLSL